MDQRYLGRKGFIAGAASALILLAGSVQAAGIYQWKDENGRVHFGDSPTGQEDARDLSSQYDFSLPFEIKIEGIDYTVPALLRQQLTSYVAKIFTIYHQALDIDYPASREFRVRIYGDERSYKVYQRRVAPILENSAGFYNSANNQITTWGMDKRILLPLITHECSHAISASHGRYIPTWLNEGLAEYFEQMKVAGLGAEVPVATYWLRLLTQRGYTRHPVDLRQVMDIPHQDWYSAKGGPELSYATSWSLVWFLMDSEQGRGIIRTMLKGNFSPQNPDSSKYIAQGWPGGLSAFTHDWQHWLAHADGSHRY